MGNHGWREERPRVVASSGWTVSFNFHLRPAEVSALQSSKKTGLKRLGSALTAGEQAGGRGA